MLNEIVGRQFHIPIVTPFSKAVELSRKGNLTSIYLADNHRPQNYIIVVVVDQAIVLLPALFNEHFFEIMDHLHISEVKDAVALYSAIQKSYGLTVRKTLPIQI